MGTVDALEIVGVLLGAMGFGAWAVVLKLSIDDESVRRAKGLNGLLKIQSYANLVTHALKLCLATLGVVPFVFLMQVPSIVPSGDAARDAAAVATRACLIGVNVVVLALAFVFVSCRSALDRHQALHGPHNRRRTDPPIPDPPQISPVRGPM